MRPMPSRLAGVLIPLFSMPSSRSWGIGEIGDIPRIARWLRSAGLRLLQLLPINEMPPGETSPYSALSAMAIDPQFLVIEGLEDFAAARAAHRLDGHLQERLDAVRASSTIDYRGVRGLKELALRESFARFHATEWATGSRRAAALRAYIEEQSWWLEDYALFRALHASQGEQPWNRWPAALRDRDAGALARARGELADDILFRQYVQWLAEDQWADARRDLGEVFLFGDLPFMVSGDSADVWARQDEFRLDASVGVPPDAFSDTGQDWALPVYRWDVFAEREFDWLRDRARRNAALFDGYRVDHLVGFYRTYFRPHDGGAPQFTPPDEPAQTALGEQVLRVFQAPGARITAEDLGVVPDFVRASLARQGIPGYKVFRWERQWHVDGQPFKDPIDYPAVAVATSGTHDTEPIAVWWEGASRAEREAVLAIPSLHARLSDEDRAHAVDAPGLSHPLHEALLETLYASGSGLLILPIQDVFGWSDRINRPATIGATNWTWRLPWPVDQIDSEPRAQAVTERLREWGKKYQR
jgi:4-alpha-glucanotransferase